MAATIYGELTADASTVILLAVGADHEVAFAARKLQTLTPLCKPTDPPGGIQLPATWPAVVQLSRTFGAQWRPGPRLTAWIGEQVRTRTAPAAELAVAPPPGLVPRSYQVEAACMIGATGSVLLFDEPGTGKTASTILGLVERDAAGAPVLPVVVVCPAAVTDSWVTHVRDWAPRWRAIAWRGSPDRRRRLAGTADVYVTSYDTARRDAGEADLRKSPLLALRAQTVVCDECLPAGTPVDTPDGPRPIEALQVGDLVLGIDHTTGLPTWTPVLNTFATTTAEPLVEICGVEMTAEHPVWTAALGYLPAALVVGVDTVSYIEARYSHEGDHHVRVVRRRVHQGRLPEPTGQGSVLRRELLREVAECSAAAQHGAALDAGATGGAGRPATRGAGPAGDAGEARRAPAGGGQPVPRPGDPGEGSYGGPRSGLRAPDGGQRSSGDGIRSAPLGAAGLADTGRDQDWPGTAVPHVVQGGHWVAGAANRNRDRRQGAQQREGAGPRREEDGAVDFPGLDGPAVHKPAGAAGDRCGGRGSARRRAVFNIETGTGNYVAGGLLVHNCHKIKGQATGQSRAVRRLAGKAANFVGLSGTPITHNPADLWPALFALEPGAWPSRERWIERYCLSVPGDYSSTVLGLNPGAEEEFRTTLIGRHRRVAKADVLSELPPKVYSVRTVELPSAWRKAYDSMEQQMLAELPDGTELSVMGVLAQLTRLAQLASAAADVEVTTEVVDDPATGLPVERQHTAVRLKAPSWKVDALLDVMAERPGEPVAAFAPSRQLMMLAGQAAEGEGYRVGYIVGGQAASERTRQVDAFQRGELDLVCVTTGAGGVGLTLTAARTAVFLQRPYSLVEALQSEDRLHRIGAEQHDSIEIIDVVARKTIDSRVRTILKERAGQLADLVQDPRVVAELLGGAAVRDLRRAS